MSPPISDTFQVREIDSAGRGAVATRAIPVGTLLFESEPSVFHVIFKTYSKETCAFCFLWDRGRALSVRDNETAKVFCSESCRSGWEEEQGEIGLQSWRCLTGYVRTKAKAKGKGSGKDGNDLAMDDPRPSREEINIVWKNAEAHAKLLIQHRESKGQSMTKTERKKLHVVLRKIAESMDSDHLSYLLGGVLFRHQHPARWNESVLDLAQDDRPYKNHDTLEMNCNSYLHLTLILPSEVLPSLTSEFCRTIVQADNRNAFGIRAGGEDSEEYMGYGVYPSASYFNHSCSPNLSKKRIGRIWQFSTARDVALGEECCITYLGGDEKDLDVLQRRGRLEETWGFRCNCRRCRMDLNT